LKPPQPTPEPRVDASEPGAPPASPDAAPALEAGAAPGGGLRRHAPKLIASVVFGLGFVWMLRRGGLPLVPDRAAFAQLTWWALPLYLCCLSVTIALRSYRWNYLLRPIADIPRRRVVGVGLVGSAAILFAPLRMGEVARPYMIAADGKISFAQAAGTIAAERIIDGLVLSVMLFMGLQLSTPLSPLPDRIGKLPLPVAAVPASAYGALLLFGTAFVSMAVFYWRRELARKLIFAFVGLISDRLATWVATQVERVTDGLRFLPDSRHSGPFLRDTLGYWASNAVGVWVLLHGCGVDASLPQACVVVGVLGVGILIPAGPGFFGAFQLSIYSALAMFFAETMVVGPGSAFVFLLYTIQVVVTLLTVGVGVALQRQAR
jgi:glycosyltransferase 2 family protein